MKPGATVASARHEPVVELPVQAPPPIQIATAEDRVAKEPVVKPAATVASARHEPVAPPPVQVATAEDRVVAADDSVRYSAFKEAIVEKPVDTSATLGMPPATAPAATSKRISRFKARRQGL